MAHEEEEEEKRIFSIQKWGEEEDFAFLLVEGRCPWMTFLVHSECLSPPHSLTHFRPP